MHASSKRAATRRNESDDGGINTRVTQDRATTTSSSTKPATSGTPARGTDKTPFDFDEDFFDNRAFFVQDLDDPYAVRSRQRPRNFSR